MRKYTVLIVLVLAMLLINDAMAKRKGKRRRKNRTYIEGPRSLRDRIAVVGGGAAGIHMAYMLKQKGFKRVEILEKRRRCGGKSYSVNYRGAPQETGTCYLAPDYEENIIQLMRKFVGEQLVHLPAASIWLDRFNAPIEYQKYVGAMSLRNFNTTDPKIALTMLVGAIMKYNSLHQKLFGNYTGELMPRPTAAVMHTIRGTYMEYLQRNGLTSLVPLLLASHTMQGYGHIDEVAALYGLMWNTPKLMNGLLRRMQNQMDTGLYMLKNGFQRLWEAMIKKEHLKISYGADIAHVYRSRRRGSWLCTRRHRRCEFYNFVMWSPELKTSLRKFRHVDEEEVDIFSRTEAAYFSTSIIDSLGVKRGLTAIDYMFSNVQAKREHSVWAQRDSYAAIRGFGGEAYQNGTYLTGDDGKKTRTTVGYQYGKTKPTVSQLRTIMKARLRKMGATKVQIRKVLPWRYFPRYNPQDIEQGVLWDIVDMQGRYGMWYIGSSVIFESVKSVVEYNKLLISKMKPPCK